MKKTLSTLIAICVLSSLPAQAATIIIGEPADSDTGNCFPFGCSYLGLYQQVYTSSEFAGPILITGLEFYNTAFDSSPTSTAMNSGNWAISLSTTSADWDTLSGTFASNLGADNTLVFSGDLSQPWTFGDTLFITFSTPFTYSPGSGSNLLMTVNATGTSTPNDEFIVFDTNGFNDEGLNGNTIMGRAYNEGEVDNGYGLVTGFEAAAVPEPSTVILVGVGLLAAFRNRVRPKERNRVRS